MNRVDAFKNELKNLSFYLTEIKKIKEKIKEIEYEEENVKGIDYSKVRMSASPSYISQKRLSLIEKKTDLEKEKKEYEVLVSRIKKVLLRMEKEEYELVADVFIRKKSYADLCREKSLSSTSVLHAKVNKIILKAIERK